ncbi:MAG: MBL fold metallo-hydrolase [Leptospiraceae bacterium]|nr:MBL fold metallo-hydrolase [Leptospiraceae bacterium]MCK6382500.1 MBL fold metallo-hydrolase [Leptospiraceae bacterium]NUM42536.1 MBL fold metallo-hydrolase [Leptospiraceae bacterium]
MSLKVETFPVYPLGCNCSIVYDESDKEAIVIDPGGEELKILDFLKNNNLKLMYIIHTHAHFDHCLATNAVYDSHTDTKVCLHKEDLPLYQNLPTQCQRFGFQYNQKIKTIDKFLEDEDEIRFGNNNSMKILHTPGHSPGSVCFQIETLKESILFSGDTLFSGSIGRTDLWGGDYDTIIKSIKTRILPLEDSTRVIPGHGEFTQIYREKKSNPFLI